MFVFVFFQFQIFASPGVWAHEKFLLRQEWDQNDFYYHIQPFTFSELGKHNGHIESQVLQGLGPQSLKWLLNLNSTIPEVARGTEGGFPAPTKDGSQPSETSAPG